MTKVIDKKLLKKLGAKESIKQLEQCLKPNTPIKYIGLVRVSTDRQEQHGQSVGTQIELISRYCQHRHYDLSEIRQLAESASKAERRKFDEMLKEIVRVQIENDITKAEKYVNDNFVWTDEMQLIAEKLNKFDTILNGNLESELADKLLAED